MRQRLQHAHRVPAARLRVGNRGDPGIGIVLAAAAARASRRARARQRGLDAAARGHLLGTRKSLPRSLVTPFVDTLI